MTYSTKNLGAARLGVSLIILLLYGVAMAALVNMPIPQENREALLLLLGNLGPLIGGIAQYYFNIGTRRQAGES